MRPELNSSTNSEEFINYYYLKEELFSFCIENSIPGNGSKKEITNRIYEFLKSGKILSPAPGKKKAVPKIDDNAPLSLEAKIPVGYKNNERHRAFFKLVIGDHFRFNVSFMNWMKENAGKTYTEAVSEWEKIVEEKKNGKKTDISSQFEYNQYTRDFFNSNRTRKMKDAIKCWKFKKSLPGPNKYEDSGLDALRQGD